MVINWFASMMRQAGKALGFEIEPKLDTSKVEKNISVDRVELETLSKTENDQLLLESINQNDLHKLNIWISRIKKLINEGKISSKAGINIPINIIEDSAANKIKQSNKVNESFPLILAAASRYDDTTLLDRLLQEGADPYLKDSHKVSALMAAAHVGAKKKFTKLLPLSTKDLEEHFQSVISHIVFADKPEILEIFINRVRNVPDDFYDNIHTLSIKHNARKIYKYILEDAKFSQ